MLRLQKNNQLVKMLRLQKNNQLVKMLRLQKNNQLVKMLRLQKNNQLVKMLRLQENNQTKMKQYPRSIKSLNNNLQWQKTKEIQKLKNLITTQNWNYQTIQNRNS